MWGRYRDRLGDQSHGLKSRHSNSKDGWFNKHSRWPAQTTEIHVRHLQAEKSKALNLVTFSTGLYGVYDSAMTV